MIIYMATNTVNCKSYIGKTTKVLSKRIYAHKWSSVKGEKHNVYKSKFYNAIRKYGIESFVWEVLDIANNIEELNEKEKYYIDKFKTIENGYNISPGGNGGDSFSNHPNKEEIREKIRSSCTGVKRSEDFKKRNRERQIGRIISPETIEKRKRKLKGRVITPEWRAKISESLKGRKVSPEIKQKISKTLSGRKLKEQHKKRISDGQVGRKHTEETKAKISTKMRGRNITPEWREKIRQGNIGKHSKKGLTND